MRRVPCLAALALALVLATSNADRLDAQVYGYTNDKGVLVLSNVPTNGRMRLIVDGTPEEAGKVWRYSGQYDGLIQKASQLFGVDAALVRAVIAVESAFNRYARSHKGAEGLMQLIPETGRRYGLVNPYDPWQNIRAGTAHLRDLLNEFDDVRLALAAYNAGSTPVKRYRGIPPYRETKDYVRKVMAIYRATGISKIEIRKGNSVYKITRHGGRTQVVTDDGPAKVPTSLAALARRVNGPHHPSGPAPKSSPGLSAQPTTKEELTASGNASQKAVYYRYTDAQGVIYITRRQPEDYPYEILDR